MWNKCDKWRLALWPMPNMLNQSRQCSLRLWTTWQKQKEKCGKLLTSRQIYAWIYRVSGSDIIHFNFFMLFLLVQTESHILNEMTHECIFKWPSRLRTKTIKKRRTIEKICKRIKFEQRTQTFRIWKHLHWNRMSTSTKKKNM